jgi:hypothetical protein
MSYPLGSEWRKWDLHVHPPGTKLSDGYDPSELDEFCKVIEESDVAVVGITDYFSADGYFTFVERFFELYPESDKVFFPNIELRLNETVNDAQEEVNLHVIFPPDSGRATINKFLSKLKTIITDGNDLHVTCDELSGNQYESATVTRDSIKDAIKDTFGEKIQRQDHVLVVTAANNDGLRPRRGVRRKENITDQVDKFSDGYFGSSSNTTYFMGTGRLEDPEQKIAPKPVYSGSDAHNLADLRSWLGKTVDSEGVKKQVTWVKADPTYEGLLQTFIEPGERVAIQAIEPDTKEPYKYISAVHFDAEDDFPEKIVFNRNLSSIIGSRSSGKSALLAYMAYSIDPQDTIERQMAAQETNDPNKVGPAAGKTWSEVSDVGSEVEWGGGQLGGGRVIYVPQNYLYSISKRPDEITRKIRPVLFENYPVVKTAYEKAQSDIEGADEVIAQAVDDWFQADYQVQSLTSEIAKLGDKAAIEKARDEYARQVAALRKTLQVDEDDLASYQAVSELISQKQERIRAIEIEQGRIAPFIERTESAILPVNISASVSFRPDLSNLPTSLLDTVNGITDAAEHKIQEEVGEKVVAYVGTLAEEDGRLKQEVTQIKEENKALIDKHAKNEELADLVDKQNKQTAVLEAIKESEEQIKTHRQKMTDAATNIGSAIIARKDAHLAMSQSFSGLDQSKTEMTFGVEVAFSDSALELLSERFNRAANSPYLDAGRLNMKAVRADVSAFLIAMKSEQKLKSGEIRKDVAREVLAAHEEVRFNATLEGDKIGGFNLSTMTPGKQALFALTLILDESDDVWPLLIDQPEDDLDSRSIYDYIVPYLIESKKERQIIMVSHNANLVVGADSEQLIVANRHGVDRKNRDDKTFDYLTGAIENTKQRDEREAYVLDSCGLREHAIDILDGGKEAFEKRRDKYKI